MLETTVIVGRFLIERQTKRLTLECLSLAKAIAKVLRHYLSSWG